MQITVNEAMVQLKMLKTRYVELRGMRDESLVRETSRYVNWREGGDRDKEIIKEPKFDAVKLDEAIVEIELAMHEIDSKIKASNAVTSVDVSRDIKELLKPIQAKV
jgi:hypothetical protein